MLRLGSAALTNRRSATKVEVKVEVKAKGKVEILIIAQSAIRHPPSEIVIPSLSQSIQQLVIGVPDNMYIVNGSVERVSEFFEVEFFCRGDKLGRTVNLGDPGAFEIFEGHIFAGCRAQVGFVFFHKSIRIHLVENHHHRFIAGLDFGKCLIDHLNLVFKSRMRDIHHMQQQVGLPHFVEGRFKGFYQPVREFADKADGIGKQERQVVDYHFAHRGVEGGEKLVFGKHVRFAQQVHQGGFAHVGIADQGNPYQPFATGALSDFLFVNFLQFFFQQADAVADDTAVGFNFLFTRAAHADTSALLFEMRPHP